jgi:hypothetical protein
VSCPMLLLSTGSLAGTPSPGPPRLEKTPAAVHLLPQGRDSQGSEGGLSAIRWDRRVEKGRGEFRKEAKLFIAQPRLVVGRAQRGQIVSTQ